MTHSHRSSISNTAHSDKETFFLLLSFFFQTSVVTELLFCTHDDEGSWSSPAVSSSSSSSSFFSSSSLPRSTSLSPPAAPLATFLSSPSSRFPPPPPSASPFSSIPRLSHQEEGFVSAGWTSLSSWKKKPKRLRNTNKVHGGNEYCWYCRFDNGYYLLARRIVDLKRRGGGRGGGSQGGMQVSYSPAVLLAPFDLLLLLLCWAAPEAPLLLAIKNLQWRRERRGPIRT